MHQECGISWPQHESERMHLFKVIYTQISITLGDSCYAVGIDKQKDIYSIEFTFMVIFFYFECTYLLRV